MRAKMKGKPCWCKGKKLPEETRKKISENHADITGEKNPMYGKHHTDETKQKISKIHSGENNHTSKLTWIKVKEIREKHKTGNYTQTALGKEYNVDKSIISLIVRNKMWKIDISEG